MEPPLCGGRRDLAEQRSRLARGPAPAPAGPHFGFGRDRRRTSARGHGERGCEWIGASLLGHEGRFLGRIVLVRERLELREEPLSQSCVGEVAHEALMARAGDAVAQARRGEQRFQRIR